MRATVALRGVRMEEEAAEDVLGELKEGLGDGVLLLLLRPCVFLRFCSSPHHARIKVKTSNKAKTLEISEHPRLFGFGDKGMLCWGGGGRVARRRRHCASCAATQTARGWLRTWLLPCQ